MASQSTTQGLSFGNNYAVLNLDWMSLLISIIEETPQGQSFIKTCSRWNNAVHAHQPQPTTIFTRVCFSSSSQPELHPDDRKPYTKIVRDFHAFAKGSPGVQIDQRFNVGDADIVLSKTRWYAGAGNALEQILKSRNIDTVIISGLTLSGVVMSTIYHLADLDYEIYVISDNVVEIPVADMDQYSEVILESLLGKMNVQVITLDEALDALQRS